MAEWDCMKDVVPFMAMVFVEFVTVGVNKLYKAATLKGLSYFVFIGYSYVIATLALLFPFFSRRMLNDLFEYEGIEYSLPTIASSISNLTRPAITFILGVIFRTENLDMRSSTTRIRIIGTILSILGALVAVLYKGPSIFSSSAWSSSQSSFLSLQYHVRTSPTDWIVGGLLLIPQTLGPSCWYIVQTQVMKMYPDEHIVSLIYFVCKTMVALPICFAAEPSLDAWTLRHDLALITVVFSGVLFGLSTLIHLWGLHLKGPLYIAIFKPFSVGFTAAIGVLFLGDTLFLGSTIGAIVLLLGFYALIWGKARKDNDKNCFSITCRPQSMGSPLCCKLGETKIWKAQTNEHPLCFFMENARDTS